MKTMATKMWLTEKERQNPDTLAKRPGMSHSEPVRRFVRAGLHKDSQTLKTMKGEDYDGQKRIKHITSGVSKN